MTKILKNKRVFAEQGGISTADATRLQTLENNELKVTYYAVVSGTSGTIIPPLQASFNSDEFGASGNALLSEVDISGKPTFTSPKTLSGTIVTATLNTTTGAWTASGVYTSPTVAIIYSLKIKTIYYSNLNYANIIESESEHARSGAVTPLAYDAATDRYTTLMNTNKLLGRGTALSGEAEEITLGTGLSMAGTTLNASPGVSPASVAEINAGTDNTKFADALNLEGSKYLTQSGLKISATASGTDTYTATITPTITAYTAGQRWFIMFTNANTGACTLNLNGLGAIPIKKNASVALATGDIVAGSIVLIAYDGTNFQMVGGSNITYGTTAGTAAQGNDSRFSSIGAVLDMYHATSTVAFNTTYFFGGLYNVILTTTSQSRYRVESPITGIFDRIRVTQNQTAGTAVATVKLNNKTAGTSVTLSTTFTFNNTVQLFTGLNLAVTIGDELEIEIIFGASSGTLPASVQQHFQGWIKV